MSADVERLRQRVAMFGELTLSRADRHRLVAGEDEERQKAQRAEQERAQQDYTALIARMNEWTDWIRAQIMERCVKHDELVDALNSQIEEISEAFAVVVQRETQRDDVIRQLKDQIADLRTKVAETRVADLDTLHANLTRSAELSMKAFASAAERAELSVSELDQIAEVGAKTTELAGELQLLREAQRNFKFSREQDDEDFGIVDLPSGYFPRSRRTN